MNPNPSADSANSGSNSTERPSELVGEESQPSIDNSNIGDDGTDELNHLERLELQALVEHIRRRLWRLELRRAARERCYRQCVSCKFHGR